MQACAAASFKLPQYLDATGHPDTCDQPSREMADLMAKALQDLAEAECFVWKGALMPVLRVGGMCVACAGGCRRAVAVAVSWPPWRWYSAAPGSQHTSLV